MIYRLPKRIPIQSLAVSEILFIFAAEMTKRREKAKPQKPELNKQLEQHERNDKNSGGRWKEKLGNYLIDISKYLLTVVFVASLVQDLADMRWLIYILSAFISALLLIVGLILTNRKSE